MGKASSARRAPASNNSFANLAAIYHQQERLDEAFEAALGRCVKVPGDDDREGPQACWFANVHRSAILMSQPPQTVGDALIALGIAAGFASCLIDGAVGSNHVIAKGVSAALANAVKLLISQGAANGLPEETANLINSICRNLGVTDFRATATEKAA